MIVEEIDGEEFVTLELSEQGWTDWRIMQTRMATDPATAIALFEGLIIYTPDAHGHTESLDNQP